MSTAKYICIVKDHFYFKPEHEVCPFFPVLLLFFFFCTVVQSCITFLVCSVRRLCMLDVHFVGVLPLLSLALFLASSSFFHTKFSSSCSCLLLAHQFPTNPTLRKKYISFMSAFTCDLQSFTKYSIFNADYYYSKV